MFYAGEALHSREHRLGLDPGRAREGTRRQNILQVVRPTKGNRLHREQPHFLAAQDQSNLATFDIGALAVKRTDTETQQTSLDVVAQPPGGWVFAAEHGRVALELKIEDVGFGSRISFQRVMAIQVIWGQI